MTAKPVPTGAVCGPRGRGRVQDHRVAPGHLPGKAVVRVSSVTRTSSLPPPRRLVILANSCSARWWSRARGPGPARRPSDASKPAPSWKPTPASAPGQRRSPWLPSFGRARGRWCRRGQSGSAPRTGWHRPPRRWRPRHWRWGPAPAARAPHAQPDRPRGKRGSGDQRQGGGGRKAVRHKGSSAKCRADTTGETAARSSALSFPGRDRLLQRPRQQQPDRTDDQAPQGPALRAGNRPRWPRGQRQPKPPSSAATAPASVPRTGWMNLTGREHRHRQGDHQRQDHPVGRFQRKKSTSTSMFQQAGKPRREVVVLVFIRVSAM